MSSETGEWKFTCTVADPKNKSLLNFNEARSRDRYGLDAIRAAIQEIDPRGAFPRRAGFRHFSVPLLVTIIRLEDLVRGGSTADSST
jgi:hypothetical protein